VGVVLVTGATGLLGRTITHLLGGKVHALALEQLDVSDRAAVLEAVRAVRPTFVVHCAALTDVDECERYGDRNWAVNAEGAGYVADAAEDVGAEIVALSTDYVFDGEKGLYSESDEPNPIQEYGRAKLAGEDRVREANPRHYIVRSAWIYGPGGKNFMSKVPELVRAGAPIKAISDQRGSPTFAIDLAEAILTLEGSGAYGTYHVVNAGTCSSAEFTRHTISVLGAQVPLEEVSRFDVPRLAPRPGDTSLVGEAWAKAGFAGLRPWQEACEAFIRT
jgi:dTDP-4-dehydrorhamnose reductase